MSFNFNTIAANTLRFLPRKRLSRTLGQIARIQPSRAIVRKAIDLYCDAYGVDLSEIDAPEGGFGSFDEFFTRPLKEGSRSIDPDSDSVISPSDGLVQDVGRIDQGTSFLVKGRPYQVGALIGDESRAALFEGGTFAVIYLHPRDYHRVHAPVDGKIEALGYIPGTLFPVNEIGFRHIPQLFANNERVVFFQQSPVHGLIATIMVGAIGVGRITVSFDDEVITNTGRKGCLRVYNENGPVLQRGAELGIFHLGSTVIILLPRDDRFTIVKKTNDRVYMGEAIARKTSNTWMR
jgi:phosphatidylserine decarboxylase